MKVQPPPGTYVLVGEKIVIVGIGINDALATRWNTSETTLIERLEKDGERSRPRGLLRIDEQIRGLDLAGCDIVLNLCDHHRNDGDRLPDTGRFGDHARFQDL